MKALSSGYFKCILLCVVISFALPHCLEAQTEKYLTDYEKSGYLKSPRWPETVQYIRKLERASTWIKLTSFGKTPQGRDLPLVIVSKRRAFTASQAAKAGEPVVLIQAGIHSGEIDGKDAGLMLLREIAVTKSLAKLADHVTILFMPIFNLDGHERQSRFNRINQNGPEEMGWRTTARNLNLNRDYLKADAAEMRAWLRCFNEWKPDLLIDCHVTDGIDFQYNLTYSMEMYGNADPAIVQWQRELEKNFIAGMESDGDPVCPYVFPREDNDLSSGLQTYAAPPRFSTGYAAVRDRAALLIETHMMKPYKARVTSTYRLLAHVLRYVSDNPAALKTAIRTAGERTLGGVSQVPDAAGFPLAFRATDTYSTRQFLGYTQTRKKSLITGQEYPVWNREEPVSVNVKYYDDIVVSKSVRPPLFYIIPQEWQEVVDVLQLHGVKLQRLRSQQSMEVESYVFSKPVWRATPYEGRHGLIDKQISIRKETITYPAGSYIVRSAQPSAKAAIHLLEPEGPDSFLSWGFFDAVFEQKEYFEDYVMEELAVQMQKQNPALEAEFNATLKSDSAFAKSPRKRLTFFYERSPYFDRKMNVYPVARCFRERKLETVDQPTK